VATIDLVADIGEGFGAYTKGDDERLLNTVTSANIACGFHAGDPRTMEQSVAACVERGVAIGAHPSFPDLVGFGRRAMSVSREELRADVLYQLGALEAFARAYDTSVRHLSPHGMLGNLVMHDPQYAGGVADAVETYDPTVTIYTLAGELVQEARRRGLPVVVMGAIDRAHEDDGSLVSRREPGAVIHDIDEIVERALSIVIDKKLRSRNGTLIDIDCQSLLLHGDNHASIEAAERVRQALEGEGVVLTAVAGRATTSD
jgi:5-oxoprolinase (ATP-hydrolysing) subunit A